MPAATQPRSRVPRPRSRGRVFDLQRFALHDGPGIRTTVFLKGCPLACLWCHNPESRAPQPQLSFDAERCQDCFACVAACPRGAHQVQDGRHVVAFDRCAACGPCVAACPHGALEIIGRDMTVRAVMDEVMRDAPYYARSGGGLTVSGGEPLAQFGFTLALLRAAHVRGVHTCLDTSGFTRPDRVEALLGVTDLFLFDYKATDAATHERLTGVSNAHILANLDFLYRRGARIILRCPLVPGINDGEGHLRGIAALCAKYPDLEGVQILPFHSLGRGKAARIGCINPLPGLPSADEATVARWIETLRRLGCPRATAG